MVVEGTLNGREILDNENGNRKTTTCQLVNNSFDYSYVPHLNVYFILNTEKWIQQWTRKQPVLPCREGRHRPFLEIHQSSKRRWAQGTQKPLQNWKDRTDIKKTKKQKSQRRNCAVVATAGVGSWISFQRHSKGARNPTTTNIITRKENKIKRIICCQKNI